MSSLSRSQAAWNDFSPKSAADEPYPQSPQALSRLLNLFISKGSFGGKNRTAKLRWIRLASAALPDYSYRRTMHVVVSKAMYQEVLARELRYVVDGTVVVVAAGVVLRQAHVALGVNAVVVAPIGDGGHSDRTLEHVSTLGDAQAAQVAAVAPTPDTDARGIHVRLLAEPFRCGDLVLRFVLAHLPVGLVTEVVTATACA